MIEILSIVWRTAAVGVGYDYLTHVMIRENAQAILNAFSYFSLIFVINYVICIFDHKAVLKWILCQDVALCFCWEQPSYHCCSDKGNQQGVSANIFVGVYIHYL